MTSITIRTYEDIHHVCLIYGLKRAYMRYPSLTDNVLASPPPFLRSPKLKRLFIGSKINPVSVQYCKKEITVLYDEERVSNDEIANFSKAIVEEYFGTRHPYAEHEWNGNAFATAGRSVAEII